MELMKAYIHLLNIQFIYLACSFGLVLLSFCDTYAQDRRKYDSQAYLYQFIETKESEAAKVDIDRVEFEIQSNLTELDDQSVTLRLVFHILYSDDIERMKPIVNAMVKSLNRDFTSRAALDGHTNDPDRTYLKLATDARISFALAEIQEPSDGKGIRVAKESTSWSTWDDMKSESRGGSDPLKPNNYINIWICDLQGVSSYATSIYQDPSLSGIVLDSKLFDPERIADRYAQGKSLTHLMGNYLGLYDLWSEKYPCLDDWVEDTPIHNAANYGKPAHQHSAVCPHIGRRPAMVMNYMDATDDEIQVMFTKGQVERMHAVLRALKPGLITQSE